MPTCCSAVGCSMRNGTNLLSQVRMFSFPKDPERRNAWIVALRRKDWLPKIHSKICNRHFVTGKPSLIRNHPDWVPSIFIYNSKVQPENKFERYSRLVRRTKSTQTKEKPSLTRNHADRVPSIFIYNNKVQSENKFERYSRLVRQKKSNQTPSTLSEVIKKEENHQHMYVSTEEESILIQHLQRQNELLERIAGAVERIEKSMENFYQSPSHMCKNMNYENINGVLNS